MSQPELFAPLGEVLVGRRGERRLRRGHPWVYLSDVEAEPEGVGAGLVRVLSSKRRLLGTALYSPASTIRLRMVTLGSTTADASLFARRLQQAFERRRRSLPGADAFRLVHGEADLLPGVFVDCYADAVGLQTTCAAADRLEPFFIEQLDGLLGPRAIVVRDDIGSRRHEGLRQHVTVVKGEAPVRATFHEGALAYSIDLTGDQKTGSFLDQVHNHVRAGELGRGRALDCFTYHGGFALQLGQHCDEVLGVDQSEPAIERARDNAARAALGNVRFEQHNVFELLPELLEAGEQFDTIVLDPPAFASSSRTVPRALAAYKEINLRAMRLLRPGGLLVSCSCSGRISPEAFDDMLRDAAHDARRSAQILERRGAGPDHPVLVGVPETDYLKCRMLAVL